MNKPIINFIRYNIEEYIYKKIELTDSPDDEKSTSPEDNFSIDLAPAPLLIPNCLWVFIAIKLLLILINLPP